MKIIINGTARDMRPDEIAEELRIIAKTYPLDQRSIALLHEAATMLEVS